MAICIKKSGLLIFLLLVVVSDILAQAKISAKEYEVYSSVLERIYQDNRATHTGKNEFVFINQTKVDPELELPKSRKYRSLVNNFKRTNASPGIVEKKFPRGEYSESYQLVSQAEIDALNEKGRLEYEKQRASDRLNPSIENPGGWSWATFYKAYPDSSGYYYLSRVGFAGKFAIVHIKGDLGWKGFSRIYILKRKNTNWETISYSGSDWVS
ncbi:MAG TPA: hypothetical protein PKA82_13295 [Pyrinomonadaceae bacterium]|nr:hypothetical protein [Pyrinomonadaceae bacterium]